MNIYKSLTMTTLLLIMQQGLTQNILNLSLAEVTQQAVAINWDVQKAEQMVGVATADLRSANSAFLPSINLSETYMTTTDPLSAFGIKLQQQITSANDFNPVLLNNPGFVDNYKTRVFVEQPIINMDGINARKAASTGVESSELKLKWTKRIIGLQAKNFYFMLQLSYEKKRVMESALEAGKENFKVASDLFDQDLIHQADLMSAELRITEIESEMIAVKNQISDFNAELTHFIGLDRSVSIQPIDPISNTQIADRYLKIKEVSVERFDIKALSLQMEASHVMLKSSKGSLLPRLNAFGSYEWNDKSLFGTNASNYLLGAKLEWDIFKGGKNIANVQKAIYHKRIAEINYQEKLSASQRELNKVQIRLILAEKQVALSALAMQQAEEEFTVRKDRFEEGLERTADVLQAESNLLSKRLNHLQSMNNYQQLAFNLEMLLDQELTN